MQKLSFLSFIACAAILPAQVAEIPTMTQPTSVIDMDAVGAVGATTVAALVAAGTNGGAFLMSDVVLTASGQALGIYNTNAQLGNALAFDIASNGLTIVAPQGSFDAFNAQIDMLVPMTEIGVSIGDWVGAMSLQFLDQGSVVGTITTTSYTTGNAKFFQSVVPFSQVLISTSSGAGNWVIAELHIQNGYGTSATNTTIGNGCGGLTLAATTRPVIGTSWDFSLGGIPATGTVGAEIFGLSDPNLNDLTGIGLPGCGLRASIDYVNAFLVGGNTHTFSFVLPLNPAFVGIHVYATGAVFQSPPINPFGAITANGIDGSLGDV